MVSKLNSPGYICPISSYHDLRTPNQPRTMLFLSLSHIPTTFLSKCGDTFYKLATKAALTSGLIL